MYYSIVETTQFQSNDLRIQNKSFLSHSIKAIRLLLLPPVGQLAHFIYVPHRTSSIQGRHTPRGDDGKEEGRLSKVKMTDLVMVISSHFISDLSFLPRRELLLPFVLWSSSRREFREIRPNCIARRRRALIKTPSCCPSDEFHSS